MIVVIAGATATGKSALAVEVSKRLNGEIVSADSMQIYRGMDVGTAKVTEAEKDGILHHMIDIVDPNCEFSVAEYAERAEKTILDILSRGKLPVIVGGTGLYIRSILYPFAFGNAKKDEKLRVRLSEEAARYGNESVYRKLVEIAPDQAKEIHPNNLKKVIRAIEIAKYGQDTSHRNAENVPKRPFLYFVLKEKRDLLYERIDARVDKMIAGGLEDEVRALVQSGIDFTMQSMQAIGYKEWKLSFDGRQKIEEVVEQIKTNSRHYAKRQETWFKKEEGTILLNASENHKNNADLICNYYDNISK